MGENVNSQPLNAALLITSEKCFMIEVTVTLLHVINYVAVVS
jgi:hypothetical protein